VQVNTANAVTDCSWVGAPVKDCVVFEGLGDLQQKFKGPGRYAVRYLNTGGWSGFNLYRATVYAYGASSITATDINGVDMTDLFQISYAGNSAATGLPVGQVSSDVTLIWDIRGVGRSREVTLRNACSWTGWC
jgi:hypothetical protein